ncbi:TonB-dependent receptor [Chitinophaga sp. Mgbs1]|uniref:TonB-dependent receptor n=1 Tax=Chitinophaga solisilvae TaxID=1233460 RepID=A0A3S1DTP0_9BACT|nr:TonB-dependent receptor [Chitinophaga solisilvae]
MKKIIITLFLIGSLLPLLVNAQVQALKGTVRDSKGVIPGAVIFEKDVPVNGTVSNPDGTYALKLRGAQKVLVVRLVGYLTAEFKVPPGQTDMDFTIQPDTKGLEEVVIVGYGQGSKLSNTNAISAVSGDEIRKAPVASLQNALSGKLPGLITQQRTGQPGSDAAQFTIRGVNTFAGSDRSVSPLIIVDDMEYTGNFSDIDPDQVETISILKDAASTAVFGIKGANGVIMVTTRRGAVGKPSFEVRSDLAFQGSTFRPRFLNAYESAKLRNEALLSDGLAPEFTQEDLDHWKNGDDPYGHPDIDWWSTLMKPYSKQSNNKLNIRGGADKMRYFVSLGYIWQDGMVRDFTDKTSEVNTNYYFKRYTYRSNLDMKVTKTLDLSLDLSGVFGERNEPNTRGRANRNRVFFEIFDYRGLPPHAYPIYNPDGSYGAAPTSRVTGPTNNIVGRLRLGGYRRTYTNDIQINLKAAQRLHFILPGLSLKGALGYTSNQDFRRSLTRTNFPAFIYDSKNNTYDPFNPSQFRIDKYNLEYDPGDVVKRLNLQLSLNYDTTFRNRHHVYALALLNQFTSSSGADLPENFRGYTFRVGYDYKKKYMLEVNGAYNGTDRFKSSKRFGFFPAVSAGWNVAEESWFQDRIRSVDLLKLRGSIGLVGSDDIKGNQYLYEYYYARNGSYSIGENHKGISGIREGTLGNENVTWEVERASNLGLDLNMFKSSLTFSADFFDRYRTDILAARNSVSNMIGIPLPPSNVGIMSTRGFELELGYHNRIGKFNYNAKGNYNVARNNIIFMDEANAPYPWLQQTGGMYGRSKGFVFDGFYNNDDEINKGPAPRVRPLPGDIRYKDLNGDNVIDQYDQRYFDVANSPTTTYGLTLGADYGNISVSVTFQGQANFGFMSFAEAITPFFGNLRDVHRNAWRPDNMDNPSFPRLSTVDNISNARTNPSDYWMTRGDFIRLKNAEISYSLPKQWISRIKLNTVRIYANGYNMHTWMFRRNIYDVDPEISSDTEGGVYPNQKSYNVGINVTF